MTALRFKLAFVFLGTRSFSENTSHWFLLVAYWLLSVSLYLLLVLRVAVEFQVHKLTVKLFRKTYA